MKKMNLRLLRNAELFTFLNRFLSLLAAGNLPALVLAARVELERLLRRMEAVHKLDPGSLLTDELADIDTRRDRQWSGLYWLARAYANRVEPEAAAAGKLVGHYMGLYGNVSEVVEAAPDAETAHVKSFLRDLAEKPELAAAAALIGAGAWATPLGELNSAFETKWLARQALIAQLDSIEKLDTLREKAGEAYSLLCKRIGAFHVSEEGVEPWATIVRDSESLVKATREKVTQRAAQAAAAQAGAAGGAGSVTAA